MSGSKAADKALLGRALRKDGTPGDSVAADAAGHFMTIAQAGSDCVRSLIIPNLLNCSKSVFVLDVEGVAHAATSRAREEMGQQVLRLDPFSVLGPDTDAFNPLDVLTLQGVPIEAACAAVADTLLNHEPSYEVFHLEARSLIEAVLGYLSVVTERCSIPGLVGVLRSDDVVYNLAVVLDTIGGKIPKASYAGIASFLQKSDAERSAIVTTALSLLHDFPVLAGPGARVLDGKTATLGMSQILSGRPVSIFLIMPAARLRSHAQLTRLIVGSLLEALSRKRSEPGDMLLMLNRSETIGALPHFSPTRGMVWTFWSSLSQVRAVYPAAWDELVARADVLQVLGGRDYAASIEAAAFVGAPGDEMFAMGPGRQWLRCGGEVSRIADLDASSMRSAKS